MATRKSELIITCNAKGVQNVMNFLTERLKGIKQQLQSLNNYGAKHGWTEDMKKDFKELTDEAAGIDTIMKRNQQTMIKYGQVMRDLSNAKLKDLKSALREATQALNKMSEKSAGRQKLVDDIKRIKDQIAGTSGLTMSFTQAQKQLKNLDNTPMDKLKQGLAAIKAQLDNPNIGNKWRRSLEQMQQQYQAAMAVRTAPISNKPVYTMGAQQLQSERSALMSALGATQGVKGYEQKAAQYAARLKDINTQLKQMAEYEKMAADGAKQLQATQEAAQVVRNVYRGQLVSLEDLQKAYQTLQARADKYTGINPAKVQQAQRQMDMLRTRIQQVSQAVISDEELQKRLANTGKYSVTQLQEAYQALQQRLNKLNTNETAAIKATQMQMKNLQREINRATGQVTGMAKAWQTVKQNVAMYVGVFAIVNKAKMLLTGLVEKNKELSDSMANIRKVSQWTSADVVKLTENMAKIDTRNTLSTLQNLAYQGAKLGIGQYGVEGLTGFVKAAEQVQTALGEDLGEEALPALAKLTEVMGLIPKFGVEQAMQKAGSAIYQLGASSTATGKNIVEFSKRLMGLANVSGVTADELLGLGSAADSMALMPEVAATAFNKLFNSIHGNTENIAKAVGIAKEELHGLLYEGKTMEALVKVFEKMQSMSMKELEGRGVFKELGSDGARLTNVMITMSNKVDMLRDHLKTANEAFGEGKAVINEYMIQQETAAAYFERASNIWTKAFINPEGVDIVKQLAQEWYNVSYEMTHSASTMASIKTTLELLAGTVKTLITMLPTLVQLMMFYGVGSALQAIYLQFRAIYTAATMAGGATARFNALLKTNAIAIAITGVLMLAAKMYELSEASKAAAEEELKRQRIFTDAAAEAEKAYQKEAKALDKYQEALKKTNVSEDERNEIIRQFKNEFGSYLNKLGIEIDTYGQMEAALKRVNKELKDKAYYEAADRLRAGYVGDAEAEQTHALSQYMQAMQKLNLPQDVMEDIVKGNITDNVKAIQKVYDRLYGEQWGVNGKLRWKNDESLEYTIMEGDTRSAKPLFGGGGENTEEIYNVVTNLINATNELTARNQQVDEFAKKLSGGYSPVISLQGALNNVKNLQDLTEEQLTEGLNVLREEWKGIQSAQSKIDVINAEAASPGGSSKTASLVSQKGELEEKTKNKADIEKAIEEYIAQLRKRNGEGYTPPPTAKELREADAAAKEALRKDLQDAKQESDAVISKIEEWYRLQETVITDMAADGKLTQEQAEQVIRTLNIAKNTALRDARLAISGRDTEAWERTKQQIGDLMLDQGKWSQELLEQILNVSMESIRQNLANIDKGGGQYGITTTSLKDAVDKNAAGNQREIARLMNKGQQEVEKLLLQYHFVEQAVKAFSNRLAQMGILTETARHMAERLADASNAETLYSMKDYNAELSTNEQAKRDMMQAFVASGATPYGVNPESKEELRQWFMEFVGEYQKNEKAFGGVEYVYKSWAKPFQEDFEMWLRNKEAYAQQIQEFYFSLMQSSDEYYKAQRQQYEFYKRQNEQQWENSGRKGYYEQTYTQLENRQKMQDAFGTGQNFAQQYGLADVIAEDPEVKLYEERLRAAAEYYQFVESHQHTDKELREAAQAALEAYMAMAQKVSSEISERAAKIQELQQPITTFAEEAGQKLGDMMFNMESQSMTWEQITKKMILSFAQMTVKMAAENLTKKIQQALFYKQMQAMEIEHQTTMLGIQTAFGAMQIGAQQSINTTKQVAQAADNTATVAKEVSLATILTQLGISEGAAKTIGALGWWGIPLVAVISSLLLGLLASALSTAGAESSSSSTSTAATPKTKLVSGMLTYDKGNVQRFIGQDGKVYTATEEPHPKDGLVTHPIATTVQGQPALVAENGPEIVVGRETTKAIMMNEPELIRYIANYDRMGGKYGLSALRAYDQGTALSGFAAENTATVPDGSPSGDTLAALTAVVAQLSQTVQALQQKGVPAYINKYGTGGLIEEVKSGLKFDRRYNG